MTDRVVVTVGGPNAEGVTSGIECSTSKSTIISASA